MVLHDEIEVVAEGPVVLDAERFAPANRKRLSGPGLRAFLNIARVWGLTPAESEVLTWDEQHAGYKAALDAFCGVG